MFYLGDYPTSHTAVVIPFDTFAAAVGGPSLVTNFAAADILVYKDGGNVQRTSAAGIVVTTSFDSQVGLQMITIDLSDNTDAGFYVAGHEYSVAVADLTVDNQPMRFWVASFSIERAGGVLAILKAGTVNVTNVTGTIGGLTAAALKDFFDTDSLTTYASAVAGSVVKEIASNAGGGTPPTAAAIATAVWQDATAGDFTVASSIGKALYVANVVPGAAGGHFIAGTNAPVTITGSGDALTLTSTGANGSGLAASGNGSGAGIKATGGATGHGVSGVGGATSGSGISAVAATSGDGVTATAAGTSKHGISATGGSTTSHGINATGGGVGHGILATSGGGATGDGIKGVSAATAGNGLNLLGNGTGNGLLATGGAGAGGDGIEAAAGGGVDMRANITGNLVGTVSTLTTYTGNTPQTGDSFARIGVAGVGLTNIVLPSGGLANVAAWSVAITGNITGNLSGSVGSVGAGGITAASFAAGAVDAAALAADAGTEIGTAVWATAARTLTALDEDNTTLDLDATIRAAVGLATANLDTQLADLPTNAELATALAAADDAVLAAIAALNNLSAAQVNAQVVDALAVDTYAEPGQGAPAATTTLAAKLNHLYKDWRNRKEQTADTQSLYADDGVTVDQKRSVSDDGTTTVRGEMATGP